MDRPVAFEISEYVIFCPVFSLYVVMTERNFTFITCIHNTILLSCIRPVMSALNNLKNQHSKLQVYLFMRKVVSLFTGAGGLDLGLEAAGFETAVAVEMNKWACATIRENRDWPLFEDDIHNVSSSDLIGAGGFKVDSPDLLIGGPPCQPFSKSAYWSQGDTKRLDDPRADTLTAYLRVLRDLRPRAFLLENVQGLTFKGKDEGLKLLKDIIAKINSETGSAYTFNWKVLNAADYGVPQVRERVYIIGSRDGKKFRFPQPTHCDPMMCQNDLFEREPWLTAWDAIGDLECSGEASNERLEVGGKWGKLLGSIPEGKNYLHHTSRGDGVPLFGWRTRYWGFLLKLSKQRPSWTIQAQPGSSVGPFHWSSRKLSTRETCRLQTFPDDYRIIGGRAEMQRQLGNAVASLMGEILGREIRSQFFDEPVHSPLKLLRPKSSEQPAPEKVQSVPKQYHELIGEHADHPGTGLGPEAIKRRQTTETTT